MEFKVGDTVRWRKNMDWGVGKVAVSDVAGEDQTGVRFYNYTEYTDRREEFPDRHTPLTEDLVLVEERDEEDLEKKYWETKQGLEKMVTRPWFEPWGTEVGEPKVPYYQFPGGVEVRQISAHLMSFPSQIMQYASRSGRVDGNCKSEDVADKIRDFEKIIDFARWEIERLENED